MIYLGQRNGQRLEAPRAYPYQPPELGRSYRLELVSIRFLYSLDNLPGILSVPIDLVGLGSSGTCDAQAACCEKVDSESSFLLPKFRNC